MEPRDTFLMMSYNILAASLGSNTIPWVMTVADDWIEALGEKKWNSIKESLKQEYVRHWHKNAHSQKDSLGFSLMRSLWSAQTLNATTKLPDRCTLVEPFAVSYVDKSTGETVVARSMCGTLRLLLGKDQGQRLFEHVVESDQQVFAWAKRGPRLMTNILSIQPSIVALQEFDTRHAYYFGASGKEMSFIDAMAIKGYSCAWFLGTSGSGTALFWATAEWRSDVLDSSKMILPGASVGKTVFNLDLEEWHHSASDPQLQIEMRRADHRTLGMIRLIHTNGRVVWFLTVHLMTKSRDNAKTVAHPGEVRALELERIRGHLEQRVGPGESVVLAGDFNTNPYEANVFTGEVGSGHATGFSQSDHQFHWNNDNLRLRSVFEDVHGWQKDESSKTATSVNAKRREWIDYIFSDLESVGPRSEATPGPQTLPTREEPSDHIPIYATLSL